MPRPLICTTLHSTMFSINQKQLCVAFRTLLPLHSTMFPINRFVIRQRVLWKFSIHSTMFPINQIWGELHSGGEITLHSTMFPINRRGKSSQEWWRRLYIPLCFLLIRRESFPSITGESSGTAMFPINPQGIVLGGVVYYLYIPLCFLLIRLGILLPVMCLLPLHSTMFPINPWVSPAFIVLGDIFTFHYVSY